MNFSQFFSRWIKCFGLLIIVLFSSNLLAETFYVSQTPSAILYDNPSEQATILLQLPYGAPVELLKTNLENGFSYVETKKGEKGWLQTSDLTETLVEKQPNFFSRLLAKFSRHTVAQTEPSVTTPKVVSSMAVSSSSVKQKATNSVAMTEKKPEETASIEVVSSDVHDANMNATFEQLRLDYKLMLFNKTQILNLNEQVKNLQSEIHQLRENRQINRWYWFFAGAGIMLVGFLLGFIFGGGESRKHRKAIGIINFK